MSSSLGDDGPRSVRAVRLLNCDKRGVTLVRFVSQSTVLGNETQVRDIRADMTAPRSLPTSLRSPLSRSIPI
jgi:hypothetical protein